MALIEKAGRPALVDSEGTLLMPAAICHGPKPNRRLVVTLCPHCHAPWHGWLHIDADGGERLNIARRGRLCTCDVPAEMRLLVFQERRGLRCHNEFERHDLVTFGRLDPRNGRLFCAACDPGAEAELTTRRLRDIYDNPWMVDTRLPHVQARAEARRQERLAASRAALGPVDEGRCLS